MKNTVISFGLLILSILILLKLSEYSFLRGTLSFNGLVIILGVLFFVLGLIFYRKYYSTKTNSKVETKEINTSSIKKLNISKREYEVLQMVERGHSNNEIADLLFISEHTIKTHISSLLMKLHAKRRTQAVKIAQEKGIL